MFFNLLPNPLKSPLLTLFFLRNKQKPTMVLMREIKDDRGGFGQRRSWWKQTTTNTCLTSSPLATEPLTYDRQSSDLWWCLRWKEKEEEGFLQWRVDL
ncbi:unnamed protein product [Camellia sinensis]